VPDICLFARELYGYPRLIPRQLFTSSRFRVGQKVPPVLADW